MVVTIDAVYIPSEDVVGRLIADELIIVPLMAGIGDMDDELYTMNETGKSIWLRLDGEKSLRNIVDELSKEFNAAPSEIETDVLGLVEELERRKMVVVL